MNKINNSIKACYINCTLKKSPNPSHTEGLMHLSMDIMDRLGVYYDYFRFVDYNVPPGVQKDMTDHGYRSDGFIKIKKSILDADILIIGTPIWLGEKSSECVKLIERLYGLSGMTNEKGQYLYYGKVGGCIITGNEDGAKHVAMSTLYALQHIGYTIPPQADAAWLGEVGPGPSYLDEESGAKDNSFTNRNITFMTYNLLHLASMLKGNNGLPNLGNNAEAWTEGERWEFKKNRN